ncbi:MAG: sensor histidine kinase [Peptostreptococcaceae bacterium]
MISYKRMPKDLVYLLTAYIFSLIIWVLIFGNYQGKSIYYCILITGGFIGVASILSCIITIDINEKSFYKYIALTFAFVSVFHIVYTVVEMFNIFGIDTGNKGIQIIFFTMGFETISLLLSFKYLNKKCYTEKFIISRIAFTLITLYFLLRLNVVPSMYNSETGVTIFSYLIRFIFIILYLYVIKLIKNNKDNIYSNTSKSLIMYAGLKAFNITCMILFDIVYLLNPIINQGILYLIVGIIRFFTSYYMIKIAVVYGIKMPNIKLHQELLKEQEIAKIRNEVLSNISHEFKTPVNVIYSAIQMQDLNIKNNNIENMKEFNTIVKQNCNRLVRLINNFIDSTKFENRNFIVNFKYVNIVRIVEEVTMSVLPFAQNKNIELIFDTCEEELFCYVDIEFIERIVLNILSNAIKYNKEHGSIIVEIKEDHNDVIISIADSGIGIPKDKMDKLFNRFDRIDRKLSRHKEGTGIGLNIVKQMVEHLNGTITIDSIENKGTTVEIGFKKIIDNFEDDYDYYNDIGQRVELELSDI